MGLDYQAGLPEDANERRLSSAVVMYHTAGKSDLGRGSKVNRAPRMGTKGPNGMSPKSPDAEALAALAQAGARVYLKANSGSGAAW